MAAIDTPVPFQGTQQERIANRRTHHWGSLDGEAVFCYDCEAKPFHVRAEYPCGAHVPRHSIEVEDPTDPLHAIPGMRSALEDALHLEGEAGE